MKEQKDTLSAVDGLLDLGSIGRPGSQPVKPQSPQAIQPCISLRVIEEISRALKVRVKEPGDNRSQRCYAVIVAEKLADVGIRSRLQPNHKLYVLLRNTPSSPQNHGPSLAHFIRRG